MNQTLRQATGLIGEARGKTWIDIRIETRENLRTALIKKHGSLTRAAETLNLSFQSLSDALGGRRNLLYVVGTIQNDLGLSDDQVLDLWPLLKSWPRKSRVAC